MIDNKKLLLDVCNIAIQAGHEILKYYNEDIQVIYKGNATPLTKADLAANKLIIRSLKNIDENTPILSEESIIDWNTRKKWNKYWLVDPLDGTKEFIKKNGEFTVNIALIENNKPVLGVIFIPAKSILYFAKQKYGSFKMNTKIELNNLNKAKKIVVTKQSSLVRIIGSRSHSNNKFINWVNEKFPNAKIIQAGSSLKFCLIAEGDADIYPRFGPTSEWDIAAGHIILNEAGGKISTFKNSEINYNMKEDILNPEFYAIGGIKL